MKGVLDSLVGGLRARDRVIPVLHEWFCSAPAVSLVLPVFDVNGSLGSPLRRVIYPPGSTLGH